MACWFRTIAFSLSGGGRRVMFTCRTSNNNAVYCYQIDQTATRSGHLSLRCVNFPDTIRSVLDRWPGSYPDDNNTTHSVHTRGASALIRSIIHKFLQWYKRQLNNCNRINITDLTINRGMGWTRPASVHGAVVHTLPVAAPPLDPLAGPSALAFFDPSSSHCRAYPQPFERYERRHRAAVAAGMVERFPRTPVPRATSVFPRRAVNSPGPQRLSAALRGRAFSCPRGG